MTKLKLKSGIALALVLGSLAACKQEATGQVAAVVNGEEITLQEVNSEIGGAELPQNVDRKAIQQAALQRIIERRLLAQAAKDDGLDKGADYLIKRRALDDTLLTQLLSQKAGQSVRVPTAASIDKFIADHPEMFASRAIYGLDRLQFPMPADPASLKALEAIHSIQGVAEKLTEMNIKFARGGGQMDSAQVPKAILDKILALPAGEPFVIPQNGMVIVSVITGSRPTPLMGDDARPLAVQAMRNEELTKTLEQRLKTQRETAKIEYQSGFAPAAAKPAGAGAPAAPKP